MYVDGAVSTRVPCTVSKPIELPGDSAPPLIVVLPTTPLPPSVPPALTITVAAVPLTVSSPPLTTAPPLSAPSFVVVPPELLVRRPETVPPTLLLNVAVLVTAP